MESKKLLENELLNIKTEIENAIRKGGTKKKNSLIRSSKVINHIHEFVKQEFINHSVSPNKIYPRRSQNKPELKFTGFLKRKNQDVVVIPSDPQPEKIVYNSVLIDDTDKIGNDLSNRAISVNVRSQLSSIGKNFDTLFERTFAESLNLHLRANTMILGEIYLVPLHGYDQSSADSNIVGFEKNILRKKYPIAFNALNNRMSVTNSNYKYERVVLLVVDFNQSIPKLVDKESLINHNVLDKKTAESINPNLFDPYSLIPDLLKEYAKRHKSINDLTD